MAYSRGLKFRVLRINGYLGYRPYYTMRGITGVFISPRVFHFTLRFTLHFRYQHVGIQNVSENARKTQEKRKKNSKCEPNARKCFYITLCVGQKRESVAFSLRFCSRFAHKLYQNANPTHSVIWPYDESNFHYVYIFTDI